MNAFELTINKTKFQATNAIMNNWALNAPWSVGYVSKLIRERVFTVKEEWENHYYQSGQARNKALNDCSPADRKAAEEFWLKPSHPSMFRRINAQVIQLNKHYGRTPEDFTRKAEFLRDKTAECGIRLSEAEAYECVRFRVIGETWNGIILRELNTIARLKQMFPRLGFRETAGEKDYQFAVDYELFLDGLHVGAIQIKPESYLGNAPYIHKARQANIRKHAAYQRKFNKRVGTLISDQNGNLRDTDALNILSEFYRKKTLAKVRGT